jgi:hypothetical protein
LPCVISLRKRLGEADVTVECTELAVREFMDAYKEDPDTIHDLSLRHKIKVDSVDADFLQVRVSQLYILSVYQLAEGFIKNFTSEHPLAKNWDKESDDDLLKSILKNIGPTYPEVVKKVGSFEIEVFDYYRNVRNRYVHPAIDISSNDKKANKLHQQAIGNPDYSRLNAPNIFNELSFDDFILFSRIIKKISVNLCRASKPTNQELAIAFTEKVFSEKPSIHLDKIRRLTQNSKIPIDYNKRCSP